MTPSQTRILNWLYDHPHTHPASLYDWLLNRWSPALEVESEVEDVAHDWRAQMVGQQSWIRITSQQREQCLASGIPVSDGLPELSLPQGRQAGFYGRELVAA